MLEIRVALSTPPDSVLAVHAVHARADSDCSGLLLARNGGNNFPANGRPRPGTSEQWPEHSVEERSY